MKIVFMGTPDFAVSALNALHAAGHDIVCVYSQPPRPAGRGHKMQPSPVHLRADALGIPVRHPLSLKKDAAARADFAALGADVAVVAAYGLILPQEVLDAPKHGCINIHASLLPRWRGAAPIQRAIMAGDDQSGVCIMQMEAGLDTGPVLMQGNVPITAHTTAQHLHDALAAQGADLIVKTLPQLAQITPQIQSENGVTYAHMLSKEDGKIDWTQSASAIERQMRALSGWPGVWTLHNGLRLKILGAEIESATGAQGKAGEIIHRHLVVACGEGSLRLTTVQPENRKPMDGTSYMNGGHVNTGEILG
ncbi:MAG: methionyl-tRNA formyltransferase [Bdellovibrionales bacterium]|jgi:methionyl-tRNA formyltransferase|nr:methionyl-tRNA formyltransferase [Bdellovibrionales bacterium]